MKRQFMVILVLLSSMLYADFNFGECSGSGTFEQQIVHFGGDYEKATTLGVIPAGIQGLKISLTSDRDVDIRLYGENDDKIVHWPYGILSKSKKATKSYKNIPVTYSGYNGVDGKKGHEYIEVNGTTPTAMTMKAFGYQYGYATVNYSWTGKEGCTPKVGGTGHFTQVLLKDTTSLVGTIPPKMKDVQINLTSDKDLDIQLYSEDGTAIVSWKPQGLLSGATQKSIIYHDMNITWSGYNGTGNQKGHEFIKTSGLTSEVLVMKVYGYQAGSADVTYSWGSTSTDTIPPVITLNGDANIILSQGSIYTELGASAVDDVDGNVSVDINGTVDTSTVGNYSIVYSATDSAGNTATVTRMVHISSVILTSITVDENPIELAEGNETILTVTAHYDNNTTKDVIATAVWQVANATIASIDTNGTLKALAEGNTTLQASYEGKMSDSIVVTVYKEINGYRLPPEPDPVVNNATLLGVDSNDNGVRDDVERYIVKTYKDKHPIHVDIAMQAARGYKLVLETPERAKEIHDTVNASLYCELYYRSCVDDTTINEKRILSEDGEIDSKYFRKKIYFNTEDRYKAYLTYDNLLSGDSYTLLRCKNRKEKCDFNTAQYEE